jgi:hypothetical protein
MEITSYIKELVEEERRENSEFRDEFRKDFAEFREWMVVHEAQHQASKQLWRIAGTVFGVSLTIAGIVVPILFSR